MFIMSKQIEIDAGHRVPYHDAGCRFLHGHRWKIVAHIAAHSLVKPTPERVDSGMVVDFGIVKQVLRQVIHDECDHRLILWEQDPLITQGTFMEALCSAAPPEHGLANGVILVPMIPTSEGLAQYWGLRVAAALRKYKVQLSALDVWETPNSKATYTITGAIIYG